MALPIVTEAFQKAYGRLNNEQRHAVDAIEGPVMVIAGPGTGKTQILTLRIANILLQTDTRPENILALTFTNAGVRAMRNRLRSFIGATAYQVPIYTFHSFAEHLIRRYPDAYPKIIGRNAATDLDIITIIETILTDAQYTLLRPNGRPDYYLKDIQSAIGDLKQEGYAPDDFAGFVAGQEEVLTTIPQLHEKGAHKGKVRGEYRDAEKLWQKNRELLGVYRRYEMLLAEAQLYDYNDMVLETVRALESDENMLLDVQEAYQYLLADEHQDVNGSQNRILELIASYHERPNIFVVGDEKQAIYRFQGASLENFLRFKTLYPQVSVVALTKNYRSCQAILDVAQELIKTDDPDLAQLRVPLSAATAAPARIEYGVFTHQAFEDAWLIEEVRAALARGVKAEEIAIIVRKNRQVEYYSTLLRAQGIEAEASSESDVFAHPMVRAVLCMLEAAAHPEREEVLTALLHEPFWNITPADLWRVLSARTHTTPLSALMQDEERLREIGVEDTAAVHKVLKIGQEARMRALVEAPQRVLAYLLEESGVRMAVLAQDPQGSGRLLRRLYDEVEGMSKRDHKLTLVDVVRIFKNRIAHGLSLMVPPVPSSGGAVAVLTAHKAKGLEYEVVLMPELTDSMWSGSVRRRSFFLPQGSGAVKDDPELARDDEIRLFYVALTRAKHTLLLSYAVLGADERERSPASVLDHLGLEEIRHAAGGGETHLSSPLSLVVPSSLSRIPLGIMRATLERRGLSATTLNQYLRSPWNYIYKNVLRVPAPKTLEQQFGTALHAVVDRCVTAHQNGTAPTMSEVKGSLEKALSRLPLSVEEYTRLHERGLATLAVYLPKLIPSEPGMRRTESSYRATLETGMKDFPELLLTGTFDRMDFDIQGDLIRVVDYKTGKPKTRGVIEGITKDSDGDYKRQLTFYALLLSLQPDVRLHNSTMVLSFLEPNHHGEIVEETFFITQEEIAALKTVLLEVTKEIVTGKAFSTICDPERCDYCDLAAKWRIE